MREREIGRSRKHQRTLALVEKLKEKGDWEGGTAKTFAAILSKEAGDLPETIGDQFLEGLALEIEDIHRGEGGMWAEFHDIAHQEWLARFLVTAIGSTLEVSPVPLADASDSRAAVVVQIDSLIAALQENIDSATERRNMPPAFDLALHDDKRFLAEVRRLTRALESLRRLMTRRSSLARTEKASLAAEALREFVLRLSGSAGEGVGKTVTWGARIALA